MTKRILSIAFVFAALVSAASCSKPLASAKVIDDIQYVSRDYAANPNDIYYAVRWAFQEAKLPIGSENLSEGVITSSWVPVASDTYFMKFFGRRDYGVTNSYHQIEVQVVPQGGRTEVKVGSRLKTLVANLQSSGIEEKKILDYVGNFVRKSEPGLTNLGVDE